MAGPTIGPSRRPRAGAGRNLSKRPPDERAPPSSAVGSARRGAAAEAREGQKGGEGPGTEKKKYSFLRGGDREPKHERCLAMTKHCPEEMREGLMECAKISRFQLLRAIGWGRTSTVYRARCWASGDICAIKVYNKARMQPVNYQQVIREIKIHAQLDHRHIVQMYAAFEDSHNIYLVQEYAKGGDLYQELKRSDALLTEREVVQRFVEPLVSAIQYLHARSILHRDIKPENMLLHEKTVKLADFGLALDATTERPATRLGTLDYMSPEVLSCPSRKSNEAFRSKPVALYDSQCDIWAIGVFAHELLTGSPPFGSQLNSQKDVQFKILHAEWEAPKHLTPTATKFIRGALHKSPRTRFRIRDLVGHPWLTKHSRLQEAVTYVQGLHQRTINEKKLRQMLTYSSTFDGKNLYAVSGKCVSTSEAREPVIARITGIPVDKECAPPEKPLTGFSVDARPRTPPAAGPGPKGSDSPTSTLSAVDLLNMC